MCDPDGGDECIEVLFFGMTLIDVGGGSSGGGGDDDDERTERGKCHITAGSKEGTSKKGKQLQQEILYDIGAVTLGVTMSGGGRTRARAQLSK